MRQMRWALFRLALVAAALVSLTAPATRAGTPFVRGSHPGTQVVQFSNLLSADDQNCNGSDGDNCNVDDGEDNDNDDGEHGD